MICFCLCTIVWASSSSLLELCFMLFGFVGLNLIWRVLKDCFVGAEWRKSFSSHWELCVHLRSGWLCSLLCVLGSVCLNCTSVVWCVVLIFSIFLLQKNVVAPVFPFFCPAEDEQRRGLLLCVRKMCFPLPILCTPTLLIPFLLLK